LGMIYSKGPFCKEGESKGFKRKKKRWQANAATKQRDPPKRKGDEETQRRVSSR